MANPSGDGILNRSIIVFRRLLKGSRDILPIETPKVYDEVEQLRVREVGYSKFKRVASSESLQDAHQLEVLWDPNRRSDGEAAKAFLHGHRSWELLVVGSSCLR
jgi:hypothetical protein